MMAAKNRQSGAGAAMMVQANSSAPPTSVATPMGSRPGTSPTGASRPSTGSPFVTTASSFEVADVDRARARHEANEDGEKTSMVTPQMTPAMKEEEAKRRSTLSQDLKDKGIC